MSFKYKVENVSEMFYFYLEDFPEIKFSYHNIVFSEPDSEDLVSTTFDLEIVPLVVMTEDPMSNELFLYQTKQLLIYLLKKANERAEKIINLDGNTDV